LAIGTTRSLEPTTRSTTRPEPSSSSSASPRRPIGVSFTCSTEEFHGPDLLSSKHLEALTEAQRLREVSDYDPSFEPTEEDVEATVVAAESFVDKVARLLAD
jgi:uncharacterized protein (UPF0332 family)